MGGSEGVIRKCAISRLQKEGGQRGLWPSAAPGPSQDARTWRTRLWSPPARWNGSKATGANPGGMETPGGGEALADLGRGLKYRSC
jgi:hypothetical protein